ncbi:alanine/glycine:cation symporter family protein [Luteithermobacter gelatinilyticus]|uniref:alanine/glycine:cation symporter family protein n=1 Tax=Luteithermobacter gelatinilyticus TaxID=2582913 RepID=UPI00110739FC|nr:alanine/glycine:cation symporter family protein [Luteithermobacter gelatinilyticus]
MKKTLLLIMSPVLYLFSVLPALALDFREFDQSINNAVAPFTDTFSSLIFSSITIAGNDLPVIVVWLFSAAIFFTLYFRFINIRGFALSLRIVRGLYTKKEDAGEVSHFQALSAALSGTVGLGNIGGVAVAISLGGPGATFWMIVVGLLGMSSKFTECTLGVKYREIDAQGVVYGGPMYYLKKGLAEKGFPKIGLFLAGLFSVFCIFGSFGGGNIFQISQALEQFINITGGENSPLSEYRWLFGVVVASLVAVVIIGGIRSIASVTSKLVPLMCAIYMLAAFAIMFKFNALIPDAIATILAGAFTPEAGYGGIIGVMIQGMRRATFSNEAGVGSAPIAHSAVKTEYPVTEGLVALLEPFIDTVIVCTTTALVIVITGVYQAGDANGVVLTSNAFATVIDWFPIVLAVASLLFAFSTMITWSYYGLKSWTFLFGRTKSMDMTYKIIFCIVTVIGATMPLGKIVDFSDAAIFAMSIPNVIGVVLLAPVVKQELNSFLDRIRSGELSPVGNKA